MRNIIFILLFAFQAAFASAATDEEKKANELIQELSRNVNYISLLSDVEQEGVLHMLLYASRYLEEQRAIKMSALEISGELYRSEPIKELLVTNKASLEEVLSQFVTYYEAASS